MNVTYSYNPTAHKVLEASSNTYYTIGLANYPLPFHKVQLITNVCVYHYFNHEGSLLASAREGWFKLLPNPEFWWIMIPPPTENILTLAPTVECSVCKELTIPPLTCLSCAYKELHRQEYLHSDPRDVVVVEKEYKSLDLVRREILYRIIDEERII